MTAVDVLKPLVAESVPVGRVTSRVPPAAGVIAPTLRASGLVVAFAVRVMALAPAPSARPAKVWALVVEALPTTARVAPFASCSADAAATMLVATVEVGKLRVNVP